MFHLLSSNWCLLLQVLLFHIDFLNTIFVGKITRECLVFGPSIKCDFRHTSELVRIDEKVNQFKEVFVLNVGKVQLHPGVCSSVYLYHVASVWYTAGTAGRDRDASCHRKELHLDNVTINYVPPNLHTFVMQNSRITHTFLSQPHINKIKIATSSVNELSLDSPVGRDGDIHIFKVNISSLTTLQLVDHATLVIADSVIKTMPTCLSVHDSATVEIIRTIILQKEVVIIQNHRNTSITIDNIKLIYQEEAKSNSGLTGVTVNAARHYIAVTVTTKFLLFLSNFSLLYNLSYE